MFTAIWISSQALYSSQSEEENVQSASINYDIINKFFANTFYREVPFYT